MIHTVVGRRLFLAWCLPGVVRGCEDTDVGETLKFPFGEREEMIAEEANRGRPTSVGCVSDES